MRRLPAPEDGLPEPRSAVRYLWWLVRRSRGTVTAGALLAILWMGLQSLMPAVIGRAVDATSRGDLRALVGWVLLLLATGAVQVVAGISRHRLAVVNSLSAAFRTIQVVVRQSNRLGSTLPRHLDSGEVMAIGTADTTHIGASVDVVARGAGALLAVVTVTVVLLWTSAPLGLIVLLGVPLTMLVAGSLISPLRRRQEAYRERQGRLTGRAADLVAGLRVLRGIGGERLMATRYRDESQALRMAGVHTARVDALLQASQVLLPGVLLVLATWLGARYAVDGRITVGQFVSFYAYAAFLVAPLRQLTDVIDKVTRGYVAADRVVTTLRVRGDLPDPAHPSPWPAGELADPESGVAIPAGRLTAIAATVPVDAARIADRLGRYAEGGTLGGVPLAELPLTAVRRRILVAENDARLFSGRLRTDLDPDDRGTLPEALHAAAASDIVDELPEGLRSVVAERGRSFSGGQQQRLRLARALVADPEVLILVEPTNAVDAHTEARIAAGVRAARAGRTTVICTSSPLVLSKADHVCYVESGRLVAAGTHAELLRSQPRYAGMVLRAEQP